MFPQSLPIAFISGRLTADPELRFTPSGKAVCNFTIACSDKKKDGDVWVDNNKMFTRCQLWGDVAESFVETATRGDAVMAFGKYSQREYETREGEKRTAVDFRVDAIGFEVDGRTTVKPTKAERGSAGATRSAAGSTSDDPWASVPADSDQPPF